VDESPVGVHSVETTGGGSDHSVVHSSAKEGGAVEAVNLSVETPSKGTKALLPMPAPAASGELTIATLIVLETSLLPTSESRVVSLRQYPNERDFKNLFIEIFSLATDRTNRNKQALEARLGKCFGPSAVKWEKLCRDKHPTAIRAHYIRYYRRTIEAALVKKTTPTPDQILKKPAAPATEVVDSDSVELTTIRNLENPAVSPLHLDPTITARELHQHCLQQGHA